MSSTVLGRNAVTVNKKYTEYFLPTVLTAMATNIAMIVDSIIAGNLLGQNSLAAINLMSPISQFYFSITILFGLGASSIISFAKGRRDEKQANRVFTSTFIVLIALSVIFIAISKSFFRVQSQRAVHNIPALSSPSRWCRVSASSCHENPLRTSWKPQIQRIPSGHRPIFPTYFPVQVPQL